jgi:hypothetical protein
LDGYVQTTDACYGVGYVMGGLIVRTQENVVLVISCWDGVYQMDSNDALSHSHGYLDLHRVSEQEACCTSFYI